MPTTTSEKPKKATAQKVDRKPTTATKKKPHKTRKPTGPATRQGIAKHEDAKEYKGYQYEALQPINATTGENRWQVYDAHGWKLQTFDGTETQMKAFIRTLIPTSKNGQPKPRRRAASGERKPSLLNLAAEELAKAGTELNCAEMVELAKARGWSTNGATPAATLSAAILRERKKGTDSRFVKVGPGRFRAAESSAT